MTAMVEAGDSASKIVAPKMATAKRSNVGKSAVKGITAVSKKMVIPSKIGVVKTIPIVFSMMGRKRLRSSFK